MTDDDAKALLIWKLTADLAQARQELEAAYLEMRKQRPAITAVFDREVWDKAEKAGT